MHIVRNMRNPAEIKPPHIFLSENDKHTVAEIRKSYEYIYVLAGTFGRKRNASQYTHVHEGVLKIIDVNCGLH